MWKWNDGTKYLMHHGIKGQKWGVRRFQNEDGSYTAAGRRRRKSNQAFKKIQNEDGTLTEYGRKKLSERYASSYEKREAEERQKNHKKDIDENGLSNNIIKKGTSIYRFANEDEPIDTKRKYVSITDNDVRSYGEMLDAIGIDFCKAYGQYTYSAIRDLKIADSKNVEQYVLNNYGTKKLSNLLGTLKEFEGLGDGYSKWARYYQGDATEYMGRIRDEYREWLVKALSQNMDDISHYFVKKGYDGIVDIEDYGSFTSYPVILLDPINKIKLKEYEQIFDGTPLSIT